MVDKKEDSNDWKVRLKSIVLSLPEKPGSYQYLDEEGTIIYVGKAKNLKRRVSSYFNKDQNRKTAMLVSKIRDIHYIVVETETDALLLENNLIKKYKPKYNILLKDDKTYPSICITKEPFPRIFKTRHIDLKAGTYFGPYSHEPTLYALLDLMDTLYQPRKCRLPLKKEDIQAGKYKVCLNYHMKKCKGACIGQQSEEDYMKNVEDCKEILKGNVREILKKMRNEMEELAKEMRFEEAQVIKERYDALSHFKAKSEIVQAGNAHMDVFNMETDEHSAYINYLHVVQGSIVQAFTFEYRKRLEESAEELLLMGIVEMRERFQSHAKEIIVPFPIDFPDPSITLTIPQRGDKKNLLNLSGLNVKQYKFDRLKQSEKLNPEQRNVRLMKEIQEQLQLPELPMHIELFDNSNISGTDAVAACVVFKRLKPSKGDYRKYHIKTVTGPDDYASMQEVVRRRYSRLIEEGKEMPDLIITDGGIGQMNCVREVVEDELYLDIPIAGLAKNEKHRTHELLYGFPPNVIGLQPDSELFRLLTRMQDEVHRFAIKFHREKRSRRALHSELDDIPGIGEKTQAQLLKDFKSVKRIKEADVEQLIESIGKSKGMLVHNYFHKSYEKESL